jgi:hypothetical protein
MPAIHKGRSFVSHMFDRLKVTGSYMVSNGGIGENLMGITCGRRM